jgi:sigma-B regulation protein RsbU (phosphoserine phosphatase)
MSDEGNFQPAHFEHLYHHAPCGLLIFNIDGSIVHCNETLLSWLELKNEKEITVKKFTDLLDKGGRIYYQLFVLPLLRMHKVVKEINFQIQAGGAEFSCLFSASVTALPSGNEKVVHAVLFKVVDRKKYEDELLSKKVKADEATRRMTEALRVIAFAQSHMVRAPLANILGLLSLYDDADATPETKYLNKMLKASARQLDTQLRKIVSQTDDNHSDQ